MAIPDNSTIASSQLLVSFSNTMHKWIMNIIGVYCIFFTFINIYLNNIDQAYATVITLPFLAISMLLYRKGYIYESKVINIMQMLCVITVLSVIAGTMSMMFMYYFPLMIASLILFQGEQAKTAVIVTIVSFVSLIIVIRLDESLAGINFNKVQLKAEQFANIIGVCSLCILLLFFSNRSMNKIRNTLIEKGDLLQKKNEQLTDVIYTRDKMMSVISHDLRSPIIALNSAMNVFTDQEIDPLLQKQIVSDLKLKSSHLLAMIDDVLQWSKAQSESINCSIDKISIGHFKNYLIELVDLIGAVKNIKLELEFKFNPTTDFILCDKNLMEAVLRNLVSNAIKFSNEGSKLKVSATDKDNKCEISIQDFGKGLTEKQIADIKNGNTFTTKGTAMENGHGLGLQLVQEFLKKQDSELGVESNPGQGSRFYFSVPFHENN